MATELERCQTHTRMTFSSVLSTHDLTDETSCVIGRDFENENPAQSRQTEVQDICICIESSFPHTILLMRLGEYMVATLKMKTHVNVDRQTYRQSRTVQIDSPGYLHRI